VRQTNRVQFPADGAAWVAERFPARPGFLCQNTTLGRVAAGGARPLAAASRQARRVQGGLGRVSRKRLRHVDQSADLVAVGFDKFIAVAKMIDAADTIQTMETASGQPSSERPNQGKRFTVDGSDELETHLERTCRKTLAGVQHLIPERKLEGLLLAGGYGRGEGGVLKTEAGDEPYNDLEFYVFISGNNWLNERRFGEALHGLARELAPEAGVEVEFKIISLAKLRHSPASMFYYDLVM